MLNHHSLSSPYRGFTLIELLVVIAIIGILSSVILSSLATARNKGADAGIKSYISTARAEAELFFDSTGGSTYDGVCATTPSTRIGDAVTAAEKAYTGNTVTTYSDGVASTWNTAQCHDSTTGWAAWVPLKASANGSPVGWCVDNRGTAKQVTTVLAINATVCP